MKYKGMARLDGRLIIHGWFKEISSLILIGKVAGMFLRDGKIIAVPEDIREEDIYTHADGRPFNDKG